MFMADGTSVTADRIKVGSGSSLFDIFTNTIFMSVGDSVRGTLVEGGLLLPLPLDPCTLPPFTCGGPDVIVPKNVTQTSLAPGTYGDLSIQDGAILQLPDFGTYTFCSMRVGNNAALRPSQQVTINVAGDVTIRSGAVLASQANAPFIFNISGSKVRISQGSVVNAAITAPNAKLKIQRDGTIDGCTCSNSFKTDKHVTLTCDGGTFVGP
jgi:hypothetical protein